jgi:hypothetical protein
LALALGDAVWLAVLLELAVCDGVCVCDMVGDELTDAPEDLEGVRVTLLVLLTLLVVEGVLEAVRLADAEAPEVLEAVRLADAEAPEVLEAVRLADAEAPEELEAVRLADAEAPEVLEAV